LLEILDAENWEDSVVPKVTGSELPPKLRPYVFHGLDLSWRPGDEQAHCSCPWCGREGKFSISAETGQWRCWVCAEGNENGGGNALTFLRLLWERSDAARNGETDRLAAQLGLLDSLPLMNWGVCRSILTREWLVPGWGPNRQVANLYKWSGHGPSYPTPEMGHQLHGLNLLNDDRVDIYVCEGWKDGVALWEALRLCKHTGEGLVHTASELSSLLQRAAVVAVPSAGAVGKPTERFLSLMKGKRVLLCFDSDHSRTHDGKTTLGAGWLAAERFARMLLSPSNHGRPAEVHALRWGTNAHPSFNPDLKSGWDVRDHLTSEADPPGRVRQVESLLAKMVPVPEEWGPGRGSSAAAGRTTVETLSCSGWGPLLNSWRKALRMRQSLEDTLVAMLAVVVSTEQQGDQLFLRVIADAGSAKTRLCDGLLTSPHCFALEHLTGFHSGWKDGSGEDFSLLARINRKTLVTPEGDVLMSSPRFTEIMSQQRRIFDGTSGASYKNRKEDLRYEGLRTPWIICGTPQLLNTDQSRLGDRFLTVVIDPPTDDDSEEILRHVGFSALRSVTQRSNCAPESIVEGRLLEAYRLTGGYVNHLRDNCETLLSEVVAQSDEEQVMGQCREMAKLTALLRARPDPDTKKLERCDTVEMPTRLTHQLLRLAACAAAVVGERGIGERAVEIARKVAVDTGRGKTHDVCRWLYKAGTEGMSLAAVSEAIKDTDERTGTYLRFLLRIGVVNVKEVRVLRSTHRRWSLTSKVQNLWKEVVCAQGWQQRSAD
jgi:hypothetical protein